MNKNLEKQIRELRSQGLGYQKIANTLNLIKASVASYYKRSEVVKEGGEITYCKKFRRKFLLLKVKSLESTVVISVELLIGKNIEKR